ncbi:MAG: NUDIX domain-containing protein [Pseudomonadota bacterium]
MNIPKPEAIPVMPAASAVILRNGSAGIEAFMVVRHHQIDFASGALVFPGGKVEPEDGNELWRHSISPSGSEPILSFWIAAIRETFEEAGLLLARRQDEPQLLGADETRIIVETHRHALIDGKISFSELLEQEKLKPALDLMEHFAHWITPPGPPRRFDTHFFLIAAPVEQTGAHDGLEATEGFWIAPRQAICDADAGHRILLPPTRLNLQKLAQFPSVQAAVEATQLSKVVTVLPRVERVEGGRRLMLPIEAGYGVSELFIPTA